MPPGDPESWLVHFSGQVQGVGFRYTTHQLAQRYAVTGTVENLPDGRVRLEAEGTAEELERFLGAVRAAFDGYIRGEKQETRPASGRFTGFTVRR